MAKTVLDAMITEVRTTKLGEFRSASIELSQLPAIKPTRREPVTLRAVKNGW